MARAGVEGFGFARAVALPLVVEGIVAEVEVDGPIVDPGAPVGDLFAHFLRDVFEGAMKLVSSSVSSRPATWCATNSAASSKN